MNIVETSRGMLTDDLKKTWKAVMGEGLTVRKLRLLPFVDYSIKNGNTIPAVNLEPAEMEILEQWHEDGHILYDGEKVYVTMPFYTAMQTVLFYGYTSYLE